MYHRAVNRAADDDDDEGGGNAGPWRQGEVYISEDGWVCAGNQRFRVEGSQLSIFPSAQGSPHRYCLELTSSHIGIQFCCKTESELRQWMLRLMPLIWTSSLSFSPATTPTGRGEQGPLTGHFKMSLIHTIEVVCSCALLNALLAILLYSSPYNLDSWFFVAAVNAFVVFVCLVRVEQLVNLVPPSSSHNSTLATVEEDLMVEDLDDTMISTTLPPTAMTTAVQVAHWNKSLPKFALQTSLRQSEDGIASPHSFTSFAENLIACCGCDLYLAQHPPSCEQMVFRDEEFEFTKSLIIVHVQLQHTSDQLLFSKTEPQPGYSLFCYYLPSSSNDNSSRSFGEDSLGEMESESTRAVAGLFASREELQLVMTCQMVANDKHDDDDDDDERGEEHKKDDEDEESGFKPQPEVSINVPNTCINKYAVKTMSGKPLEVLEFNVNLRNLDLLSKLAINALLVNSGLLLTHHLRLTFTISTQHQKHGDKPTASIRLNLLDLTKVTLW
ncbi:hypothetical protein BASA81_002275 [Batrachochytrium salamandrivorans]|nr:hypothetical protein BASA81_002275 [Batrachochytrium salamandrivorans]